MKIGFVLDDTLDSTDGVQQYVLALGAWLTQDGHDVHYLTAKSARRDVDNLHSLGRRLRVKFNRNVVPLALPTSAKKLAELLEAQQFDVLHVQMPYNPAFGARVIALAPRRTAVVGTFHIAPYSKGVKALSKALGYWLKPTTRHFDAVMSVSKPAQQLAGDSFGLESVIVPNMVSVGSYKLAQSLHSHQPAQLIFIGRLVERKGCQHFIQSLALVDAPFKATIVGDGNQRSKLEKLVKALGLDASVKFVGFVSEQRKRSLLSKADIAVFPSTGGESFGIVLIEAMAAGSCIVLAGNNPGYASVLGQEPQSLIEPADHPAFAKTIQSYINHPAEAQKLYRAQQKLINQYDVPVVASQVLDIYRQAVAKRSSKSHTTK